MPFDYRLVLELLNASGHVVGQATIEPDWQPAVEWTRVAGLRTRGVWAPDEDAGAGIEPLWHDDPGEPYMRGFRVHLAAGDARWHEDFPTHHFAALAQAAGTGLVEAGTLAAGDRILYRTLAYRCEDTHADAAPAPFVTVNRSLSPTVRDVCRQALLDASAPAGDTHPGDFDVFIPDVVLDGATTLTDRAGDVETGGVLIGHLARDGREGGLLVEITALVPARHTVGDATRLTFTSDTWTDVRRAVELRRRDEKLLGWFHSHPQLAWCREKQCPVERQRQCAAADGFFSAEDLALHRTMFPRAFTVALVMTRSIKGIVPRLFGWRAGLFGPRGFRVLARAGRAAPVRTAERTAENSAGHDG